MRLGICTGLGVVNEPVDVLDFIEGTVGALLCPAEDDSAFGEPLAAVKASAVAVEAANCFVPGDLKTTGPDVDTEAVDAFVSTALERAGRMGLKIIVFGSGGSRQVPDGWDAGRAADQLVEHMKRWGPMAAAANVTITLEPLSRGDCNIVHTVDEAADLVRRVDHPNIRVLCDTYHMGSNGDPPEAIHRAEGLIAHVHVAEVDGRGPLGTLGEDQRPHFRALKDIGYEGRLSVEASWKDLPAQLPAALAELRRQVETA